MAALGDSHRYTLFRNLWSRGSDEAKYDGIAGECGVFEKGQLVPRRVRKDGLEHEAFALGNQRPSNGISHTGSSVGIQVEFAGQYVSIDETQTSRLEVSVVESRFASTIRSRQSDNNRTLIGRDDHYFAATFALALTVTGMN